MVIRDKLFVSNTDNAHVLYVRQLTISGDLHKIEQRTPCKNTTAVSLIVKTYKEITMLLTAPQNFTFSSVSLGYFYYCILLVCDLLFMVTFMNFPDVLHIHKTPYFPLKCLVNNVKITHMHYLN